MIDIREVEEGVLIETGDFNMCMQNLYNEIKFLGKDISDGEARRFTCSIIGSLVTQGLVTLVKSTYLQKEEDLYELESERGCTDEELDFLLKEPERWEEMNVFSLTEVYELAITEKGRLRLEESM